MEEKAKKLKIDELFGRMPGLDASDLHLKTDCPPVFRISGQLQRMKGAPLTDEQIVALVRQWLGEEKLRELREKGSLDVGHDFDGGRVRVNVFMQRGKVSLAARLIESNIPTLSALHLPEELTRLIDVKQGLVLVCGPTGTGKSTTLASIIQMINQKYRCHILTIEDPIEYLHHDEKSIINQREMGLDCRNWAEALRAAVREDPDVILVGEMRDEETFQAGLIAAETGHLVFGTLHTSSAAATLGRILDLFPTDKHSLIRQGLCFNLKAVVCQKLVPSFQKDLDVVPAIEFMLVNAPIRKAIEDGEDARITDLIKEGEQEGMISWTTSFVRLINGDYVERKVARQFAPNQDELMMALSGIGISHTTL